MRISSDSFADGAVIPAELAFCVPDPESRIRLGSNRNPQLAWTEPPPGTRSLVLICHDPDVPSVGDDVNREGRTIAATLPRVDFFHWILIDLPPTRPEIRAGEFSDGIVARGKPGPDAPHGARQGINDYTAWFASDPDMNGDYHGYDGPCPPWNDEIPHRYVFTLHALDIDRLPLGSRFSGNDVRAAIAGHVLASATLTGRYTLNPGVRL
jgi:Raf kinase inhibitor-like YbhB/YbcL family protein